MALPPNGFQDRLVMTASIRLRVFYLIMGFGRAGVLLWLDRAFIIAFFCGVVKRFRGAGGFILFVLIKTLQAESLQARL